MDVKKYFLGLDIGTNSVGWAVTDQDYHVIRKQGKHLWGVRLFPEANSSAARREHRVSRRRLQRRRWRISLLQDLFYEEMNKVDSDFFVRLNNSSLHNEDKPENCRDMNLLFKNSEYNDSAFYKRYPTIYHLRKVMIEHPENKFDIREIYLVMAHMIKYRGNFLMEGDIKGSIGNDSLTLVDLFNQLDSSLDEREEFVPFALTCTNAEELISVFKSETRKSYLFDLVSKILNPGKEKGLKVNILKVLSVSY